MSSTNTTNPAMKRMSSFDHRDGGSSHNDAAGSSMSQNLTNNITKQASHHNSSYYDEEPPGQTAAATTTTAAKSLSFHSNNTNELDVSKAGLLSRSFVVQQWRERHRSTSNPQASSIHRAAPHKHNPNMSLNTTSDINVNANANANASARPSPRTTHIRQTISSSSLSPPAAAADEHTNGGPINSQKNSGVDHGQFSRRNIWPSKKSSLDDYDTNRHQHNHNYNKNDDVTTGVADISMIPKAIPTPPNAKAMKKHAQTKQPEVAAVVVQDDDDDDDDQQQHNINNNNTISLLLNDSSSFISNVNNSKQIIGLVESLQNTLGHSRKVRASQEEHIRKLASELRTSNEQQVDMACQVRNAMKSACGVVRSIERSIDGSSSSSNSNIDDAHYYDGETNNNPGSAAVNVNVNVNLAEEVSRFEVMMQRLLPLLSQANAQTLDSERRTMDAEDRARNAIVRHGEVESSLSRVMVEQKRALKDVTNLREMRAQVESEYAVSKDRLVQTKAELSKVEEQTVSLEEEMAAMQERGRSQEKATRASLAASNRAYEQTVGLKEEIESLSTLADGQREKIDKNESVLAFAETRLREINDEANAVQEEMRQARAEATSVKNEANIMMEEAQVFAKQIEDDAVSLENSEMLLADREKALLLRQAKIESTRKAFENEQQLLIDRMTSLEAEEIHLQNIQQRLLEMRDQQVETEQEQEAFALELNEREEEFVNREKRLQNAELSFVSQCKDIEAKAVELDNRGEELNQLETSVHDGALQLKLLEENLKISQSDLAHTELSAKKMKDEAQRVKEEVHQEKLKLKSLEKDYSGKFEAMKHDRGAFQKEMTKFHKAVASHEAEKNEWNELQKSTAQASELETKRLSEWEIRLSSLDEALQRRSQDVVDRSSQLSRQEKTLVEMAQTLNNREEIIASKEVVIMEANRMREHQERRSLASLADAKAELASNQTRLQENERRCKEARDDYDRIKSDARTIRASLRAKLLNGEKEFDDITQRCSEKESEVADIESQIDNLVKKRQKASAEKEKVETQKALMLKDLDDQLSLLTARQAAESDILNKIERKVAVAKEKFADMQQNIRNEKEEAERKHLERITEMKAELVNLEQRTNASLEEEKDIARAKIRKNVRFMKEKQEQLDGMDNEIRQQSKELVEEREKLEYERQTFLKEKESCTRAMDQLAQSQSLLDSERAKMRASEQRIRVEMESARSKSNRLEFEAGHLRSQLENLSSKYSSAEESKRDVEELLKGIEQQAQNLTKKEKALALKLSDTEQREHMFVQQMEQLEEERNILIERELELSENEKSQYVLLNNAKGKMLRLETKEMELEEKSRKSEAQEKRFRQKFLKVAAVSLNSKLRRVMISRTFMHWRRVTWSECARETENAARAALSDGINLMESSRAQLQNAQNEADRKFEAKRAELMQREVAVQNSELELERNLRLLRDAKHDLEADWQKYRQELEELEALKMNMTKVEEETMQRKGALAEREKEIDKVRSDLDRGLAQVESSFKDNASETSRIRSSLVAQQEELEQEQKLLSERIAVLRSQEQALADKKLALDKKTSDLADLESLLLLREKKVDEREMGLQHEKALIKKAQEQLEEREFSLEKKENEVEIRRVEQQGMFGMSISSDITSNETMPIDQQQQRSMSRGSAAIAQENKVTHERIVQLTAQLEEKESATAAKQNRLDERLKACDDYESRLSEWEGKLEDLSISIKKRESEMNTRELRIIERM